MRRPPRSGRPPTARLDPEGPDAGYRARVQPSTRAQVPRLNSLTGLRAFAALLVFGHHAVSYGALAATPVAVWITSSGVDGVSFFFILSGFVLAWSSREGDRARAFWRRRAARVLPLYVLAWVAGSILVGALDGPRAAAKALPSLLLVQSWIPDPAYFFAGNSPGWSLSCEAFFYLSFPLLISLLRRTGPRTWWWIAGGALLAIIVVPLVLHPESATGLRYWFVYVCPINRMSEFVLGVVAGLLVKSARWPHVPLAAAAPLAVASVVAANLLPRFAQFSAATALAFVVLLAAAARRDASERVSPLSWRPLVKAGEWSFAFYLVHLLVVQLVVQGNRVTLHLPSPGAALIALPLSGIVAAGLCELVEKPLERRFRSARSLSGSTTEPSVRVGRDRSPYEGLVRPR